MMVVACETGISNAPDPQILIAPHGFFSLGLSVPGRILDPMIRFTFSPSVTDVCNLM